MKMNTLSCLAAFLGLCLLPSGPASAQQNDADRAKSQANFASADGDGDGALSRAEFEVFVNANAEDRIGRARQIRRFGAYGRAFSTLDKDGDGKVTGPELSAVAQSR